MSKRQPGTGGSNEGTGNILGVPDESTVISRASSEGTGSKPESSISHLLNQHLLPVKNHSLQLSPPTSALQQSSLVLEMVKSRLLCKSVQDLRLLSIYTPDTSVQDSCKSHFSNTIFFPSSGSPVASRAVEPVGLPSITTNDQDEQSSKYVHQQSENSITITLNKVLRINSMDIKNA
ncbi:hypothetical protein Tco_1221029 [Tanacetum coccineum]